MARGNADQVAREYYEYKKRKEQERLCREARDGSVTAGRKVESPAVQEAEPTQVSAPEKSRAEMPEADVRQPDYSELDYSGKNDPDTEDDETQTEEDAQDAPLLTDRVKGFFTGLARHRRSEKEEYLDEEDDGEYETPAYAAYQRKESDEAEEPNVSDAPVVQSEIADAEDVPDRTYTEPEAFRWDAEDDDSDEADETYDGEEEENTVYKALHTITGGLRTLGGRMSALVKSAKERPADEEDEAGAAEPEEELDETEQSEFYDYVYQPNLDLVGLVTPEDENLSPSEEEDQMQPDTPRELPERFEKDEYYDYEYTPDKNLLESVAPEGENNGFNFVRDTEPLQDFSPADMDEPEDVVQPAAPVMPIEPEDQMPIDDPIDLAGEDEEEEGDEPDESDEEETPDIRRGGLASFFGRFRRPEKMRERFRDDDGEYEDDFAVQVADQEGEESMDNGRGKRETIADQMSEGMSDRPALSRRERRALAEAAEAKRADVVRPSEPEDELVDEPTVEFKLARAIREDARPVREEVRRPRAKAVYEDDEEDEEEELPRRPVRTVKRAEPAPKKRRVYDDDDEYDEDGDDEDEYDDEDEDGDEEDEMSFGKRFLGFLKALIVIILILLLGVLALQVAERKGAISLNGVRSAVGNFFPYINTILPEPETSQMPDTAPTPDAGQTSDDNALDLAPTTAPEAQPTAEAANNTPADAQDGAAAN